ncbi:unnamed protein product [Caenorhabditis sp. 36 PRJEB53466]|nr:unnamed protein product [Caenorhabditis sp. 36 PRJEB53466]
MLSPHFICAAIDGTRGLKIEAFLRKYCSARLRLRFARKQVVRREMKSRSRTRLERRVGQLIIFYKRKNETVEEEMIRVSVEPSEGSGKIGSRREDTLRSSASSPSRISSEPDFRKVKMVTSDANTKAKEERKRRKKKQRKGTIYVSRKWKPSERERTKGSDGKWIGEEGIDEETRKILDDLRVLNSRIRKRFGIGLTTSTGMAKIGTNATETDESVSASFDSDDQVLTAEAYDWRGCRLLNPLALTPFAGHSDAKKARRKEAKEREKRGEPASSRSISMLEQHEETDSPNRPLVRFSSNTRFPGARSPATRQRARRLLQVYAESRCSRSLRRSKRRVRKSKETESSTRSEKVQNKKYTPSNSVSVKGFDHKGMPLSNPMAVTPFPRACSTGTRDRARKMLVAFALKEREKERAALKAAERKKEEEEEEEEDSPSLKPTRFSSDTRFPGARSPASREKARAMLQQCQIPNGCDEEKEKEKEKKKTLETSGSMKTIYSKSSSTISSNSSSSNRGKKKKKKMVVKEGEREQFHRGISELREQMKRPERSRNTPKKKSSGYDVTQSHSDESD